MFGKSVQLAPAFASVLLAAIATQASGCARAVDDAPPPVSAAPAVDADRVSEFRPENLHKVIFRSRHDMILEHFMIYERPSDGVLELQDGLNSYPIAESWRLYEFDKADWVDRDTWNEIYVIASYATGMGPEGARPFRAKIIMERTNSGWAPSSTVILADPEDASEPPPDTGIKPKPLKPLKSHTHPPSRFDRPVIQSATTPEEHQALIGTKGGALADLQIDFANERLVVASIFLTSGSMKLRNIRVQQHKGGYHVTYEIYRPRIGTADIKRSALYVVLPADGLPVKVFERGRGDRPKGERIKTRSGIINRF